MKNPDDKHMAPMTPELESAAQRISAAITGNNEGSELKRLREDLALARRHGPNAMVMTTQEAVRAGLMALELARDAIGNPAAYSHHLR